MRTSTSRLGRTGWNASVCAVAIATMAWAGAPAGAATTVPGAPTISSTTPGLRSVSVAFGAPASDGGARILEYRVACTSSDGGVSRSRTGHVSPIRVAGLTAAKTYTCDVEARNRAGYGPPSAESAPVVTLAAPSSSSTVPGAPTISSTTPGLRSVSVAFGAPASDGGARIVEYRVVCTSSDGGATRSKTRRTSPIRVTLSASKTYTCDVKAKNRVGFGASSALSAPFVTLAPPVVTVPGAPTITSAVAGQHDVTVAFSAPASSGGALIFQYKATCTSSDGGVARSDRRARSSIRVNGLTSAKTYTCTVAAKNRKGFGAESSASAAVVTLQN
jgi:hypothetical protein